MAFKTKVLHFKIEITPRKYTSGKRKFKSAQIPFCVQTRAFRYEIVFRGIQPCFLHGRSERLACFEPGYDICRLQTADRRPQTADRRPQTADRRLQTADCRLQTADRRLQIADCKLKDTKKLPNKGNTIKNIRK